MRHELPVTIGDPFLLGVVDGQLHVMASDLERSRIEVVAPAQSSTTTTLSAFASSGSGISRHELELELASRAVAAMGIREATVDPEMPVAVADRLRADGIVLHADYEAIAARRRAKSAPELAGIRRAQAAAEAGMSAAAELLRHAGTDSGRLMVDGEALTAESVRASVRDACQARGAPAPPDIIVSSPWSGFGHDPGSGPLPADLPIVIDLWPRDEESGCWADMTRTFVVGEVSEQVRAMEALVLEAIERAREAGAKDHRTRAVRPRLRCVRAGRVQDAEDRTGPDGRFSVRARPRRRPRPPRGAGPRPNGPRPAGRRRRHRDRAGPVGARGRRREVRGADQTEDLLSTVRAPSERDSWQSGQRGPTSRDGSRSRGSHRADLARRPIKNTPPRAVR